MKNLLLLLLLPSLLFAQTPEQKKKVVAQTNTTVLKSIASKSKIYFIKNKIYALQLAKTYNWPSVLTKDGTYSELIGVTADKRPIYYTTYNYGAGITSRANKLYSGGSLGLNINGEDMTAAVWDAGSAMPSHELFSGRSHVMDNTLTSHYHSTHVAGTIIGSDQFQGGAARGMAYKASVDSYDWNQDISEVATAAGNGLLLSNHSYGKNPYFVAVNEFGKYDLDAQSYDNIMFNAPYYEMVCAAGNSRGGYNLDKLGYDLLTGHALCKNGITVAAVNEVLNYTGPGSVEMSAFSSWGPTDDGRIKPDISAKGVNTFSAIDSSTSSYDYLSGTSMASPSVAGTLLLYQQYYNQLNGSFMKAATLRGLMIHTADEAGPSPGPDYSFGWGLINAENAANVITKNNIQSFIQENTLQQGNSYSVTVNSLGTEPLMATLCWTDPQGTIPDTAIDNPVSTLVNDLDIRITQDGNTYFPWKLDVANPSAAATKGDNTVDNVEKAAIDNPSGTYTVTVSHKGNLFSGSQNYSLIISGITIKDFWFSTAENTKAVCAGTTAIAYAFDLHTKSNFDDTVALTTIGLPPGISAIFNPSTMTAAGNFQMNLSGVGTLAPGIYTFVVKGLGTTNSFEMPVTLKILSPAFSGTVLLQPANGVNSVILPTVFNWQSDANAEQFDIIIATDANFTSVVQTATVSQNTFTSNLLLNSSLYYWKVKPKNRCGEGVFSAAFSFSTVCGLPTAITQLNTSTTTAKIGWTENSGAGSWEIEVVPQGTQPTGTGIMVTSNPYTFTDLTRNTCYDFYLRSNCGVGTSSWTSKFTFCTQPDYCAGDHFYDSGGATGNYQNFESKTTVIYPQNSGDRVKAVFSLFHLDAGWDYLRIYNGPNASYPLLSSSTGTSSPGTVIATNPSGALTFVFTSYNVETYEGWDAAIICEPLPPCPISPSDVTLQSATYTTATIGWTENVSSASWNVEVVPRGTVPTGVGTVTTSNPYIKTGLASGTYYDFYVQSNCSAGTSSWSGPFHFNTAGNYCAGDHFYDDGGPNGNYPIGFSTKTIYPDIAGNRIKAVFNSFSIDQYAAFNVYNGPNASYPQLFFSNGTAPGTLKSTHISGALTFEFYSFAETNAGWDASIVCEPLPPCPNAPSYVDVYGTTTSSAYIYWNENSGASSWELEVVLHGTAPTGAGIITSNNPYTKTGLASNTWYDVYVRSKCSNGNSEWSSLYTFNTLPDYCAGDHFYDDGGPGSNYPSYDYVQKTIYPDVNGERIKAVFNSFNIAPNSNFTVYNGPGTGSPVLFASNGSNAPGTLTATSPSGAMTFLFSSNSNTTAAGWDATISCEALPPCSNAPSNINVFNITTSSVSFYWTENSNANSWEVEIVPHGTAPTGIGTVTTTNPYTKSGLVSDTWYDFYVRSRCGNVNSLWTSAYTFHTAGNYCSGDHFYDSGGPNDNYAPYEYTTTTIYPTGTGNRVKAIFNSFQLGNGGTLNVYNGPDSGYPLIYSGLGNVNPGTLLSTHLSGALTFLFTNYNTITTSGWDASIICEPLPPCSNPPSGVYLYNTPTTTTATLNWTDNSGANSWEIEIVPHNTVPTGVGITVTSKPYVKTGLTSDTWYDFYVRSKCGTVNSQWSIGFTFNTAPNYCSGDHFYDPGGPDSNYSQFQYQTTTISPVANGDRVKAVFNSFQLNPSDYFEVYNGPGSSYPLLFSYNGSNSPGTLTATNTYGVLYFVFSGSYNTAPGWDASIVCEPLPPCSNAPTLPYLLDSTTGSATLAWTENSNATSWEVEIVLKGTAPSGVGVPVTANPYTKTGLLSDTWYDFYVRSKCGSTYSAWTAATTFNTKANYCSGDHFYDSGGPNGNYSSYEYKTTTIFPGEAGTRIKSIFNLFQITYYDYFGIYNGPDASYPLLYSSNGGTVSPGTVTSTDQSGALTFVMDASYTTNAGWDATIVCEPIPACALAPSNITTGVVLMQSAVLNWTENSNASSWEIEIVLHGTAATGHGTICSSNSYTANGLTANTCYDAYVRSICGADFSAWTALTFCSQPDYCGGDHFYDSGGASGNYQNGESTTTVIYPENPGDKVKVIFNSFFLESSYDYLRVYNGPSVSAPLLLTATGASLPGSIVSTHATGALTFRFTSDSSDTYSGWDATIECVTLATLKPDAFDGLEYFPNPVHEQFYIKSKNAIESYEVYDVNSRLIIRKEINEKEFSIKMNNVSTGVYFVKLFINDTSSKNIKILKN